MSKGERQLGLLLLLVWSSTFAQDSSLWLEGDPKKDPAVAEWIDQRTKQTRDVLERSETYRSMFEQAIAIYEAPDRVYDPIVFGKHTYRIWQDASNRNGLLQRTAFKSLSGKPVWENIFDVRGYSDSLNIGKEKPVPHYLRPPNCLPPHYDQCLFTITVNSRTKGFVREFDMRRHTWTPNGFSFLKPGVIRAAWWDFDHIFVESSAWRPENTPENPYETKFWGRGEPVEEADTFFKIDPSHTSAWTEVFHMPDERHRRFILMTDNESRYRSHYQVVNHANSSTPFPLHVPKDAKVLGFYTTSKFEYVLIVLRSGAKIGEQFFPDDSVVAIPARQNGESEAELVLDPKGSLLPNFYTLSVTSSALQGKRGLFLQTSENGNGKIVYLRRFSKNGSRGYAWEVRKVDFALDGSATLIREGQANGNRIIAKVEDYIHPPTYYWLQEGAGLRVNAADLMRTPERFRRDDLITKQLVAPSEDGTTILYTVVGKKSAIESQDASHPAIITAYGGFGAVYFPTYLNSVGKLFLERGGIYVFANVRGGGEFGSNWHRQALRTEHYKSADDLVAVAQDLMRRNISSSIGLYGRSHGGLVAAMALEKRPELFTAVALSSPLADMTRFHRQSLGRGFLWIDEYGNPDDPIEFKGIAAYSPLHHVESFHERPYPPTLVIAAKVDGVTHSSHAFRFVDALERNSQPVMYLNPDDWSHGPNDPRQNAYNEAIIYSFLYDRLIPKSEPQVQ